jgi:hypothetical protein
MYLAWALFCEGNSDYSYFEVLLPRVMEEMTRCEGIRPVEIPSTPTVRLGRNGRSVEDLAGEVCGDAGRAIYLLFISADTGGHGLAQTIDGRARQYCLAIHKRCGWPRDRCVRLTPRHETEAWVLADPNAVRRALGFTGQADDLGLPRNAAEAERLTDPKSVLTRAADRVRGRRSRRSAADLFVSIAQLQSIAALRAAHSFQEFEARLRVGLADLGCLPSGT